MSLVVAVGLSLAALPAVAQPGEDDGKSKADKKATGSEDGAKGGSGEEKEEEKEDKFDAHGALNQANRLAGRGAWTRSIPHYEKVLKHAWDKYPSAHYNLAGVLKAKKKFARALLHYQAYMSLGSDPATKKAAKKGMKSIRAQVWDKRFAKLSIDVEPETKARIIVDGFVVSRNQDVEEMVVLSGKYTVRAEVEDHHPDEKTVTVKNEGSKSVKLEPRIMTFHGKLEVTVNKKGATVRLRPKDLKSPDGPDKPIVKKSPVEESVELVTGKWLLEVTLPEHHRWVRYIQIQRDETNTVDVKLSRKLPEEIR